ncbi:MAG: RND transporter, partial [Burkholderiales bacterium]|nr:RND transporter [Burkholderiales bacterium]
MTKKKTLFTSKLVPLVTALLLAGCASTATFTPTAAPAAPAAFKELDGRWAQATP